MKTSKMNFLFCSLLLAMALLMGVSCAAAEEQALATGHVELLSEGCIPTERYSLSSRADMSDFNTYILSSLKDLPESIDISKYALTLDEFRTAYRGLLNSRPEMFYVSGAFSYYPGEATMSVFFPSYKYEADEIPAKLEAYNRKLNEIMNYANKATSTIGKLMRASDYICVHYEYDEPAREVSSPEVMFETGRGVCNAYTLVYVAVCNKLGVTNTTASSDAMNHIWNVVNLDGSWYHVDVTWNDPIADAPYRAKHNNLLRSDAGITETGHHDWVTSVKATNTRFDSYFWQDIDHAVPVLGDTAYFTPNNNSVPDGRICTANITTGAVSDFLSYVPSIVGRYYPNINPVWATSTTVYYTLQDTVYAMPMAGGESTPVFSLNDKTEYLFYFYLSGNTMYVTSTNMDTQVKSVHSFKLDIDTEIDLADDLAELTVNGDGTTLSYTMEPEIEGAVLTWSSSDSNVATVDAQGLVTPVGPGVATITLQCGASSDDCTVVVHSDTVITIPDGTTLIDVQAFAHTNIIEVTLPEGMLTIGNSTFANCAKLQLITIPATVTAIADNAFDGCDNVTILCTAGSDAETYAINNNLPYILY